MLAILTTLTLAAAPQAVDPLGSIQRLDVPTNPADVVLLDVVLDSQPAEVVLRPHSLRSGDFSLYVTRPNGSLVEVPAPAPKTWRGEVDGWPDTTVTATIDDKGLAMIVTDHVTDREWQVQPAIGYAAGYYSVVRVGDLPVTGGVCGVPNQIPTGGGSSVDNRGTGLQLCEMAFDADFEFYQRNGSSVTATVDDIERVMNRVDTIYVRDCDVTFQITAMVIRSSSNDPYTFTDAGALLDQFRNHWNNNFQGVRKDLAHLMTGKNLNGGTIGVAYLGVVCNQSVNYGLSESRFTSNIAQRTGLTAHEVGHNFNSQHCNGNGDCRIMCSGLGGCNGDVTRFGSPSANGIRNYAINRGCLLDLAPPLALPILDEFPTSQLNRDIWISQQGVDITNAALNEPSPTLSARLAAQNSGLERDDRLISNKILLAGLNSVDVSFFTQHRGVPAGGALDVEILDSSNDWILLERVVSDGVDETDFTFHSIPVPAGAYHDEAQLRITADVDSSAQQWFIDDVKLEDNSCGAIVSYCVGSANSASPTGAQLLTSGSTSVAANDLVLVSAACPPMSFGIHIYGDAQTQQFLGNGFLCVTGNPVYRLGIVQNDLFGNSVFPIDLNNLPPGSVINAGDTFNFQLWYRDSVGAGFNLTQGLEINFCP